MYRKTKTVSPYFRMPNPHDPMVGNWAPLMPSAPYCRFELSEELTTAMDFAEALITDQYGYGPDHSFADTIVVLNYLTKAADEEAGTDAVYRFSGKVGDAGLAVWDDCQKWLIVEMEGCCGLRGACLDENHPGRGVAFDICMGTWDPTDASGGKWVYDCEDVQKAIDWRYAVPYPDAGATGLFEARESDEYGIIWEVVALDCLSPGDCGD